MKRIILRVDGKHSTVRGGKIILDQGRQQAIFIMLFTVLYLFRDLAGVNVPDLIFSGLCAVAFVLMDRGTSLGIYIFTTALTVPHNEIVIVYLVISLYKMFSSGKVQLNGRMFLMNIGLLFLQLLNMTMFSKSSVNGVLYDYITRMLIIFVPVFWCNDAYSAEDFRSALLCYVAGAILGGTVTMILTADVLTWEALLKGTGGSRLGRTWKAQQGMQTSYNSNQLAVMFAISVAIILQYIDKKRISKTLGIVLAGYSLFLIFLTRSRTGLLVTAMAAIIYYLIPVVRRKKLFAGILLLGIIGAMVFAVATFIPDIFQSVIERFVGEEDISNGRITIFTYYIQEWVRDPWCFFFGFGIGSYYDALGIYTSPHNAVTDILISLGLVGMIIIAGIIGICYNLGTKSIDKKERVLALLPALVALIACMGGQYISEGYPHTRLCFLLLAAQAVLERNDLNQQGKKEIK